MTSRSRSPAGVPTGGQFSASVRQESGRGLSATDALLARKAAESEARFRHDVAETVATYRSAATFRDPDYIGSANLSYTAYEVAEASDDQAVWTKVEDACEVLEDDPGNRQARDTCAEVVRAYASADRS